MINSHLMLWNVYPETTAAQRDSQTADFFAMGGIPEVSGMLLARRFDDTFQGRSPGRFQANPYRRGSGEGYERIRPIYDYFFAIEFPEPADEAEGRYGPNRLHLDFAWRNCRTIWSEYLHQDFLTETVEVVADKPDERILHFDFWNYWPDADPAEIDRMYQALARFAEIVPGLLRIRLGRRDPSRPRGATQIGVREELGLRGAVPWHFKQAGGQFDGYFQMEFSTHDEYLRYVNGPVRINFAAEFVHPLWSEYHTQRFERLKAEG